MNRLRVKTRRTAFYLREYFFPFGCTVCGKVLIGTSESLYGLCESCMDEIDRMIGNRRSRSCCDYCGKPLISEADRCLSCRNGEGWMYDRAAVLFPYMGKYRKLLTSYKFKKNIALGNYFASKIIDEMKYLIISNEICSVQGASIVPVPPRPGKIRENGWDQVEYLARLLERADKKSDGLTVNRCLRRLPSQSQKELGLENRLTNLKGRIVPVRSVPKVAVVLDDVMTTGSTLNACASALKKAGTETVYGLCLFYD